VRNHDDVATRNPVLALAPGRAPRRPAGSQAGGDAAALDNYEFTRDFYLGTPQRPGLRRQSAARRRIIELAQGWPQSHEQGLRAENATEDEDEEIGLPALPAGSKNYMTPAGHARMQAELSQLVRTERPSVVSIVSWAAGNGDRSENGDYIYGKKRLREIDRRIRFLTKRLENALVVDPLDQTTPMSFISAPPSRCSTKPAPKRATASSAWMKPTPRVAAFPGFRHWRAPCSRRASATACAFPAPGGVRELEIIDIEYKTLD
jgi:transcription elongation factor GreB